MTKYIEIDRAIETALLLLEEGEDEQTLAYNAALVTFVKNMENQPAADVQEVKHGRWLHLRLDPDNITGHTKGECSICGKLRIVDNYCPNCGAKMEVDE